MNIRTDIVIFGIIMMITNLAGGYHLDEQVNYPHNSKHSKKLSKKMKKYIFLIDKKNKHECLRASYIQEIAGYIELLISIIIAIVFLVIDYVPIWTVTFAVIFTVLGVDLLYTMVVYFYYWIKYK